ncbi:tetraprenyl-beta-curcumene synthase family protein [Paenibacillaceae bacterium]|nr:tetraprenyl-beta-curcumene synthase family protein [Paenibacillaceae bacterium]
MQFEREAPGNALGLMFRVYKYVLPGVHEELGRWHGMASDIPDGELRAQALDSLETKRFHCEGGAIYAAANLAQRHVIIPLIVALQTISDYLDNLCDRSTSLDPDDFRLLHQSMLDAVNPGAELRDYYALRDEREDGGYLHALVRTCQSCTARLPAYETVRPYVNRLVALYSDLQVHKHVRQDQRESRLRTWWEERGCDYIELQWNEFAAASGSTLGMFMLFLAATDSRLSSQQADAIFQAYFPHVCGLHILLDYLIDQEEDREGGDLNFCNYYPDSQTLTERFEFIAGRARNDVRRLPAARFHRMIIEGLLALYLSDPKARSQSEVRGISKKLMKRSPMTRVFFWINSMWIRARHAKIY